MRPLAHLTAIATAAAALLFGAAGCDTSENSLSKTDDNLAQPDIVVEPPQLVWTGIPFGATEVQTFTVTNGGDAALEVSAVRVELSAAFTVLTPTPATVPPGGSLEVEVAYSPIRDEDVGRAFVDSNDAGSPTETVELIGTSGSPRLVIDPPTHDFGAIAVLCRDTVVHTLRNEGNAELLISSLYQVGEGYTLEGAPALPLSLMPGEEAQVAVKFAPLNTATFPGALYAESNDPAGVRSATHSGTGLEDAFCVEVTPGEDVPLDVTLIAEYRVADIAFLLDTTCSMSGLANAMAGEFSGIATDVSALIPDVTFGVATYEDYNFSGMGSGNDTPFRLGQQQTSDLGAVQSALSAVRINSGDDISESTIEALFQGASGLGYDEDCDGTLDTPSDVQPFQAQLGDAFGGTQPGLYNPDVEGTGDLGGFGFREKVLPIFIYATDADMRDPDAGYRVPTGSCGPGAGMGDALSALGDLGAKTIGINVNGSPSSVAFAQMTTIAEGTGSFGDMDGDGDSEAAAVVWSGSDAEFREILVEAIDALVTDVTFDEVWLDVVNDPLNLVKSINPEKYTNVPSGEEVDFRIEFYGSVAAEEGDETYPVAFELKGLVIDKEVALDRFVVYVLVPGA
jgi:hypothetical protein